MSLRYFVKFLNFPKKFIHNCLFYCLVSFFYKKNEIMLINKKSFARLDLLIGIMCVFELYFILSHSFSHSLRRYNQFILAMLCFNLHFIYFFYKNKFLKIHNMDIFLEKIRPGRVQAILILLILIFLSIFIKLVHFLSKYSKLPANNPSSIIIL